jgi:Flp pilus assembly pilin Flp
VRAFNFLRRTAKRFLREESGATAAEYAILIAAIVVACVAGVAAFRAPAGSMFDSSGNTIGTYADP